MSWPVQFSLLIGRRDHQGDVLAQVGQLQGGADWVGGVTFCCQYEYWDVQDLQQAAGLTIRRAISLAVCRHTNHCNSCCVLCYLV